MHCELIFSKHLAARSKEVAWRRTLLSYKQYSLWGILKSTPGSSEGSWELATRHTTYSSLNRWILLNYIFDKMPSASIENHSLKNGLRYIRIPLWSEDNVLSVEIFLKVTPLLSLFPFPIWLLAFRSTFLRNHWQMGLFLRMGPFMESPSPFTFKWSLNPPDSAS